MTIDEELRALESQLRRLKIEYEIFFSNPQKKPPSDLEWKVLALLRKFSDGGGGMNFSQRFRYNEIAQRYAIYSDLWRKKSRIREEGYRRPQDALLSCQGVRSEEHDPEHKVYGLSQRGRSAAAGPLWCTAPTPARRRDKVEKLFLALSDAKKKLGKMSPVRSKVSIRLSRRRLNKSANSTAARTVEYIVEVADGKVKLRQGG